MTVKLVVDNDSGKGVLPAAKAFQQPSGVPQQEQRLQNPQAFIKLQSDFSKEAAGHVDTGNNDVEIVQEQPIYVPPQQQPFHGDSLQQQQRGWSQLTQQKHGISYGALENKSDELVF